MPATTPSPSPSSSGAAAGDETVAEPPPRQCGRCRAVFEGDPTLHATAIADWWLCPPCHAALLGVPAAGRRQGRPSR